MAVARDIDAGGEGVDDIHVVPCFDDEPEHEAMPSCWCEPEIVFVAENTGARVWLHRRTQ